VRRNLAIGEIRERRQAQPVRRARASVADRWPVADGLISNRARPSRVLAPRALSARRDARFLRPCACAGRSRLARPCVRRPSACSSLSWEFVRREKKNPRAQGRQRTYSRSTTCWFVSTTRSKARRALARRSARSSRRADRRVQDTDPTQYAIFRKCIWTQKRGQTTFHASKSCLTPFRSS